MEAVFCGVLPGIRTDMAQVNRSRTDMEQRFRRWLGRAFILTLSTGGLSGCADCCRKQNITWTKWLAAPASPRRAPLSFVQKEFPSNSHAVPRGRAKSALNVSCFLGCCLQSLLYHSAKNRTLGFVKTDNEFVKQGNGTAAVRSDNLNRIPPLPIARKQQQLGNNSEVKSKK